MIYKISNSLLWYFSNERLVLKIRRKHVFITVYFMTYVFAVFSDGLFIHTLTF